MFEDIFVEEQRIWSSKNIKGSFLIFVFKTFSLNNKGFGVLKNEKGSFLIFFKAYFVEEGRIWSSKKRKKKWSFFIV